MIIARFIEERHGCSAGNLSFEPPSSDLTACVNTDSCAHYQQALCSKYASLRCQIKAASCSNAATCLAVVRRIQAKARSPPRLPIRWALGRCLWAGCSTSFKIMNERRFSSRVDKRVGEICLTPSYRPLGFSTTSKGRHDTGPVHRRIHLAYGEYLFRPEKSEKRSRGS